MLISNFAKRALKIGIILGVSLLAVEFLMTFLDPYLFKDRFENDPDMGFKVRAYYPTGLGLHGRGDDGTLTNQFGFNDRDYSLQKAPGVFRIVVLVLPILILVVLEFGLRLVGYGTPTSFFIKSGSGGDGR